MKYIVWLILFESSLFSANSQIKIVIIVNPDNYDNGQVVIKNNFISKELIFSYKKNKAKDSALVLQEYYDSTGNIQEKDQFSVGSPAPWKVTNYWYGDNRLIKKEIITPGKYSNYSAYIYEYDTAGNRIFEYKY